MTNLAGTGTSTKGLNAPKDWWLHLGRAASSAGVSIGEYVRQLAEAGARRLNPMLAVDLAEASARYYGAAKATALELMRSPQAQKAAVLLLVFCTCIVGQGDTFLRARRVVREESVVSSL